MKVETGSIDPAFARDVCRELFALANRALDLAERCGRAEGKLEAIESRPTGVVVESTGGKITTDQLREIVQFW